MGEGKPATMPPKIIREMPLPMPFSEIMFAEPHKTIVPAIIMEILVNLSKKEICPRIPCPCNIVIKPNPARNRAERSKAWSTGANFFSAARLAFFLIQFFKFGENHSEELHYD